jgi:phage tail-like protein
MAATYDEFVTVSSFTVELDGHQWSVFESVDNVGVDFEDIAFSGNNNSTMNRPGRMNARDIVLTRRFKNDPEFYSWIAEQEKGNPKARKTGAIIIKNDDLSPVVKFDFENAWVKSWKAPKLTKSTKEANDIAIETIVLSISNLKMSKA